MSDALDIEPKGDTIDGTNPKDPDMHDTANSIGEVVQAKRPRRGKRVRFPIKGEPGYVDVLMP